MKKYYLIIYFLAICFLFHNCTYIERRACGELPAYEKKVLDSINIRFNNTIIVKAIPCENLFLNITIKIDEINDSTLYLIHDYIREKRCTWQILSIYDSNGQFLFQQIHKDSAYYRTVENSQ
jgi:hypothetical protein